MIQSVCLLEADRCLLAYDGKKFTVIGDSSIAEDIRRLSGAGAESLFSSLMKEAADDFDPVRYWYESSMNFADEDPPVPYDENLFQMFKDRLELLK